jgi:hypothetical protein
MNHTTTAPPERGPITAWHKKPSARRILHMTVGSSYTNRIEFQLRKRQGQYQPPGPDCSVKPYDAAAKVPGRKTIVATIAIYPSQLARPARLHSRALATRRRQPVRRNRAKRSGKAVTPASRSPTIDRVTEGVRHSVRSLLAGSIFAARRAGMRHAQIAIAVSTIGAPNKTSGSRGPMSKINAPMDLVDTMLK